MSREVMGVQLVRLEDPIYYALQTYQNIADNGLSFDAASARKLTPTPDKTNSARSTTPVLFRGEKVGDLYVIAFKPGDGTGSEADYKLSRLTVDLVYPEVAHVVPRRKSGVHHEAHLTVLTHPIDVHHSRAQSELFQGSFDLLGLDAATVRMIGILGHKEGAVGGPMATLTVGYTELLRRFADPHAVYSLMPGVLQVCAFFAVSEEVNERFPDMLKPLNPRIPV